MTTLSEWQAQLGTGGVLLGAGTSYQLLSIDGLERNINEIDHARALADGAVMGPDWAPPKTITIELLLKSTSPSGAMALYDALAVDWASARTVEQGQTTKDLRFRLAGRVAQTLIGGRPRRIGADWSTLKLGWLRAAATYFAPDPRIYSDAVYATNLVYGAAATALPNVGNTPAPVVWLATGAVTSPGVIRNAGSDRWDLTGAVMTGGQSAAVSTDPKTAIRTGGTNWYSYFSGKFLEVPPGGANFQAVGTSGGSQWVTATYRDTWL